MTLFNGSPVLADPLTFTVQLEQRTKAMATRLTAVKVLVDALDSEAVPTAAAISSGIAAEIALLLTYGVTPGNPVPG